MEILQVEGDKVSQTFCSWMQIDHNTLKSRTAHLLIFTYRIVCAHQCSVQGHSGLVWSIASSVLPTLVQSTEELTVAQMCQAFLTLKAFNVSSSTSYSASDFHLALSFWAQLSINILRKTSLILSPKIFGLELLLPFKYIVQSVTIPFIYLPILPLILLDIYHTY